MVVRMNSEVEINCDAFGIPEPIIKIQRMKSALVEQEFERKKLKFNFTRASSSRYRCFAQNELGSIQKEITVKHYGKVNFFY